MSKEEEVFCGACRYILDNKDSSECDYPLNQVVSIVGSRHFLSREKTLELRNGNGLCREYEPALVATIKRVARKIGEKLWK